MFWSVGLPLLRAEGFFYNFNILYGGLGIGKLQFLIKKKAKKFSAVILFQFLVIKALDPDWIRIRIRIRIRIGLQPQPLDPDPEKMNTDPQPWTKVRSRLPNFGQSPLKKGTRDPKTIILLVWVPSAKVHVRFVLSKHVRQKFFSHWLNYEVEKVTEFRTITVYRDSKS